MRSMVMTRLVVLVGAAALATGVTLAAIGGGGSDSLATAAPAAWIDDPLDQSVIFQDSGEITVLAHATDVEGIVSLELSVDGAPVKSVDTAGGELEQAQFTWTPAGPGTYELSVIGRDPAGKPTEPGMATITVESPGETTPASSTTSLAPVEVTETTAPASTTAPTPSTVATSTVPATTVTPTSAPASTVPATTVPATSAPATTAPVTTAPPTTVPPCLPDAPINISPFDGESTMVSRPTFKWVQRGCQPDSFDVTVIPAAETSPIQSSGQVTGSLLEWTTPTVLACGTHRFLVRANGAAGSSAWSAPTSFTIIGRAGC